jgi:hypothetical protein
LTHLLVFGQFVLEKLRVSTVFEKTLFGMIANDATLKKNLKKTKKKKTLVSYSIKSN